MTKINFIIPDFINVMVCQYIQESFRKYPNIFMDDINILGYCGMFPGCSWNMKDKEFNRYKLDIETLVKLKKKYEELHTSLFIIFDKEDITANNLDDEYSNDLMKIFNNEFNYVICKSKKLRDYIKEKFKKINIVEYFNEENSDSKYLILNSNIDKSSVFSSDHRENFIIISDGGLIPNRRNLFKHTKKDSKVNLIDPKKTKYYSKSNISSFYEMRQNTNYLKYEDMKTYTKNGINKFMLSGLGVYNFAMIENIVETLFKEEYKFDQKVAITNRIFSYKELECCGIYSFRL